MRRESLQESRETVLALTDAEARTLAHLGRRLASTKRWWGEDSDDEPTRTVISCRPVDEGRWGVTVANMVGLIAVGDLQIAVEPKIPSDHFLYLLARSGVFPRTDTDRVWSGDADVLWALVAGWFVGATERVLRGDLVLDYALVGEEVPSIRGRAEPVSVAEAVYRGRLSFACEFDDFVVDTPLNRAIRAAADLVASNEALEWSVRRRARRLLERMDGVGALRAGDEHALLDRRTNHYRDAHTLAWHVLTGHGRVFEHGDVRAWSFLLPSPPLIEEGLRAVLRDHLAHRWTVEKRGVQIVGPRLTFNPDLVFNRGLAVADVKYRLSGGAWRRSDVNQLVTFAAAYQSRHCALVWFRGSTTPPLAPFALGGTQVREIAWGVDDDPSEGAAILCTAMEHWLETAPNRPD